MKKYLILVLLWGCTIPEGSIQVFLNPWPHQKPEIDHYSLRWLNAYGQIRGKIVYLGDRIQLDIMEDHPFIAAIPYTKDGVPLSPCGSVMPQTDSYINLEYEQGMFASLALEWVDSGMHPSGFDWKRFYSVGMEKSGGNPLLLNWKRIRHDLFAGCFSVYSCSLKDLVPYYIHEEGLPLFPENPWMPPVLKAELVYLPRGDFLFWDRSGDIKAFWIP